MALDIFLGVVALAVVALTLFLVPALIQLKNTASQLELFLKSTSQNLEPLLLELRKTTEKANILTSDIEAKAARVDVAFKAVEHVGHTVEGLNHLLKERVDSLSSTIAVVSAGVRGAVLYFTEHLLKREKKNAPAGPHYY